MSNRSDIQKQLCQIISLVNVHGYKMDEIMPQEMQDHFHDITALKEAKEYIKEVESREKQLQAENLALSAELRTKQAEIDDEPENIVALKVDLQQSERRIDYYKKLAEDAQGRAERYQRKLTDSEKTHATAGEETRKIERLESELADHATIMFKLLEENRVMANLLETHDEENQRLIEEKDAHIANLINHANQLELEKTEAVELSEKVSETYDQLIQSLEQESMTAAEIFNHNSVSLLDLAKSNDQLYSTIATEIAPLNSFYDHAFSIMATYQYVFQSLSNPNRHAIASIPATLDAVLDAANEDLLRFQVMSTALQNEGLAQEKVRRQVDDMAKIAARMYISLDSINDDVAGFLSQLRSDPNAWIAMKGLDRTPKAASLQDPAPTPSIASFRSSMTSFVSMAKRFSSAS